MKYQIKYKYETGNSFGCEDSEDILEYDWNDLSNAKNALKRIQEHYMWYCNVESHSREKSIEKPLWHNVTISDMTSIHCILNLKLDNGKEIQFWPPWIGYFEKLHGAEIINIDSDTSFVIE